MKTIHIRPLLLSVIFCLPFIVNAGWHAVRNDGYNAFQKVFTVNDNTAFVIGGNVGTEYFLLRTNDGGSTWDSIHLNLPSGTTLYDMFFVDSDNGFIGGVCVQYPFLIKTTDKGDTWTEISPDTSSNTYAITAIQFIDEQNGYVSDGSFIYKTLDGGATWETLTPFWTYITDVSFVDMNTGFVTCTIDSSIRKTVVIKTVDGGLNWTTLLSVDDGGLSFGQLEVINSEVWYVHLSGSSIFYKTVDGGSSWNPIVVMQTSGIQDFSFKSGHVLSYDSKVFRTDDDGQNWTLEYAAEWGFYGPSIYYNSISFAGNTGFMVGYGMIKKYSIPNIQTGTVETESSRENIQLYPNPLAGGGVLHINTSGIENQFDLQIINANGQVVFERNQVANTPDSSYDLNLAPGVYYTLIQTSKTRNVGKLIITE